MIFKILLVYIFSLVLTKISIFLLGQRTQLSEVVFLFLFLLWLKDLIKDKRLPHDTGLNKPFLIFIAFCILSFFNSSNLVLSTMELLGLIYLFIMLILVVDIVDNRRKLDIIVKFWVGILTVVLALGFIGLGISMITGKANLFCSWIYHGAFPYLKDRTIYRASSAFHNPLALANYLIVSLGLVASELLLTENRRYRNFLRVMIFLIFLIMITLLSRELMSLLLSSFLIYNCFCKVKNLRFRIIRFSSFFLIIGMFLFFAIFGSSFYIRSYKIENFLEESHRKLVVNIDYAYDARLAYKRAALEMIKRHPFMGVGLAMYRPYLQRLNDENYFYFKNFVPIYAYSRGSGYFNYLPVNDPHNDVLQYFAETGIFGGIAFILFIAAFLYLIFTNLRKRREDRYFRARLFCFLASFIGVLIESIDLDVFKVRPVWFLMALTLALIMMHKNRIN